MLMSFLTTRQKIARAAGDKSGTAAIEFAMISPLLLVTLLGGTEITQAVMAARKAATATRTMADLTAQIRGATDVTAAMVDEIYAAGRLVMSPFPSTSLKVTISRVDVTEAANVRSARTTWSVTRNGASARPCGLLTKIANTASPALTSFPSGMYYPGRFIVVDIIYTFAAPLTTNFAPQNMGFTGWTNTGSGIEIRKTAYMQTRLDGAPFVTGTGNCPVA
ncbi:MAG: TadE/TadG family type IV pilus assembly protein [Beijerinckiaceae bacterium]|nr:TadE/TadG family type IV pilus assembly protein [Beijerinckiaceae bacterium]